MFKLINTCRLCRSYENINTTLHHIDSDNLSFFQKLNRIAPGILENNTNLPDGVCMNCITELNIAYKFINKCSESQAIFERYFKQLQNGQQVQPANQREILIKVIKLEESNCDNSEVNSNNCVTVNDEKESGFLNKETNDKYNVNDYASDNSESDQANFQNDIKVEEEIRNIHATDDIQTDRYEFVDVTNIKIDEGDFENDILDLPKNSGNFSGFELVECDLANGNKVKYDLKLESLKLKLAKVINNEHMMKNVVDKVLESESEIGENSSNVNMQAPTNKYKICEKACNQLLNLTRRKRTAKKLDKPYQCTICGRATPFLSNLKQHMLIHTNEKPFKCETCMKAFTSSSTLKQHIRIHTNEKPFKCETCGKAFNSYSNLNQHTRIHTNEKLYKCETCNKSFNQSSALIQHIRIHTNEKPFKCGTCGKGFNNCSNLKQHIRIHANEKLYKCETCNRAFNLSSHLKKHIRIHSNKK